MRVTLAFPPALCLPNQLYLALPLLAGALRRGGHEPAIVDLNVRAADLLLDEPRTRRLVAACRAQALAGDDGPTRCAELEAHFAAVERDLLRGGAAKRALRDPARFYDAAQAREAFWTAVDVLAGFYQLDEILSPYHDRFVARMQANQREDRWTATGALWDEGLLEAVFATRPQVLGVCVAFPEQTVEAVRLARKVRRRDPSVHIVFGGPMISRLPEKWLADGWLLDHADSVVLGDGESAIVELCDALEGRRGLDSVRNLVWRDRAGHERRALRSGILESMDELPAPDFSTADMAAYLQPEPIYPLMTSRGCYWGKCAMCSIGYQENYRMASKEKLRADLHAVVERGGRYVQLQDSSVPPKGARYFAEIVLEDGLDVAWAGWMKFETCFKDERYCDTLARGGCKSLQMGYESSDQRLLDLMQKGYRHEDLLPMLRNLRAAGISTELLWFIGFPTQTRQDVIDSTTFLWRNRELFGLSSFVGDFGLHPDCEVYRDPKSFGVRLVEQVNGRCSYEVDIGISMQEATELKAMLSGNNNRTLTCNGCHLLHLARNGLDLASLARPMHVPAALLAGDPASEPAPVR